MQGTLLAARLHNEPGISTILGPLKLNEHSSTKTDFGKNQYNIISRGANLQESPFNSRSIYASMGVFSNREMSLKY